METGWWGTPLMYLDLAKVTHKSCTNFRQSQIPLFLAASIRTKESLSISLATQHNLEYILLFRTVDQQKDEILEPPFVPHSWIKPATFHYATSLLFHTFSTFLAHYPHNFSTFPVQQYPTFPSSPSSQWQIDHSKIATFLYSVDRTNAYDQ